MSKTNFYPKNIFSPGYNFFPYYSRGNEIISNVGLVEDIGKTGISDWYRINPNIFLSVPFDTTKNFREHSLNTYFKVTSINKTFGVAGNNSITFDNSIINHLFVTDQNNLKKTATQIVNLVSNNVSKYYTIVNTVSSTSTSDTNITITLDKSLDNDLLHQVSSQGDPYPKIINYVYEYNFRTTNYSTIEIIGDISSYISNVPINLPSAKDCLHREISIVSRIYGGILVVITTGNDTINRKGQINYIYSKIFDPTSNQYVIKGRTSDNDPTFLMKYVSNGIDTWYTSVSDSYYVSDTDKSNQLDSYTSVLSQTYNIFNPAKNSQITYSSCSQNRPSDM